ncbi:uncharacterized protein LOC117661313 [Pantherophis guttatus]|uniref:Uncharacterized protein LOC117654582 n=1 Tax=Pantherophis guttatus TaxID=94885 RepID=A0A6P9BFQ1_PANGU|nr:uncharacterized protein LOC117654582 [Pantherophis guttatus]XP_034257216.1 uncharacterized protein LOC117654582 [Pantherophis guttatus]XP_034266282.1 uncharacterized protein LOC117661313 [Pantherophis guttatus]XP_034267101.1 uncharacterized protein LOC117661313 [Pantherophis guttatus]
MANTGRANLPSAGGSGPPRAPMATVNRLETERGFLTRANIPPAAIKTIQAARRPSTARIYESTWRSFSSWCSARQVCPTSPSVEHVIGFLQEGFDSGLAPSTLRRQVAALASISACASLTTVTKDPLIRQFLRGASNLSPPVIHRFPTWDLSKVLSSLTQSPFEPLRTTSLKFLSFKVSFLVAITSARRISELAALSIRQDLCVFHHDKVVLRLDPTFLPKVNSVYHRSQEVALPNFCPRPSHRLEEQWHKLDVRRALRIYLSRSASFRKTEALFVSFQPTTMGIKVSAPTLGRWIRATIAFSYESQSLAVPNRVTAHSTRSAATSAAWATQASLEEVCKAATWSTPTPFIRHYRLDAYASADAAFGRRVLQRVHVS